MTTELPTDAVLCCLQICENFASDGHNHIVTAREQLQALLDENKRLLVDRDFWRQTAVDMEQSIQNCISDNDRLGYMLNGAIRGFNDAVDARLGDKQ